MKISLHGDDALIHTVLAEQWQLVVTAIHFIPIGDSAYSYRVETQPNSTYYLKIVDLRSADGQRTAARMEWSLPLQSFVAQQQLIEIDAPHPQPTIVGALYIIHEPFLFALYTFITGKTLGDAYPMSSKLTQRIGQALATLHTVQIPKNLHQQAPQDGLVTPFDANLRTDLAALETVSTHDAPYRQRLREVVLPRHEQIHMFIARSQEYRSRVQQTPVASVVCHGDPWGGNMILAPSGKLTFLDWETAVIAPPERDAFMYIGYIGPNFAAFNTGYLAVHKEPIQWHTNWLAYYAYRMQLKNLAHWLHNVLHEPLDEAQRDNDITMIEYHCLDRWEHIERATNELANHSVDGLLVVGDSEG